MRPGVRRLHTWSLDSLGCVLGFWVHWGAPWESSGVAGFVGVRPGFVGFIRGRWGHSGALCRSSGSSVVAGFIRVRHQDHHVHGESMSSLGCAVRYIPGRMVH